MAVSIEPRPHVIIHNIEELAEAIGVGLVGTATGGSANTLEDSNKSWDIDMWKNDIVVIIDGTGEGQARLITSNDATTLTVSSNWDTIPDNTSKYVILTTASVTAISEVSKSVASLATNITITAATSHDIDVTIPSGKSGLALTVKGTSNSGLEIYVYYSPDGTNFDTEPAKSYNLPSGTDKQQTWVLSAVTKYLRITINNPDASVDATDVNVWATYI